MTPQDIYIYHRMCWSTVYGLLILHIIFLVRKYKCCYTVQGSVSMRFLDISWGWSFLKVVCLTPVLTTGTVWPGRHRSFCVEIYGTQRPVGLFRPFAALIAFKNRAPITETSFCENNILRIIQFDFCSWSVKTPAFLSTDLANVQKTLLKKTLKFHGAK